MPSGEVRFLWSRLGFGTSTSRDTIGVYLTSLFASSSATSGSLATTNAVSEGLRYDLNINGKTSAFGFADLEGGELMLDPRFESEQSRP